MRGDNRLNMDNVRVFYNIAGNYWVELSHQNPRPEGFYKVDDFSQLRMHDKGIVEGWLMNSWSNFGCIAGMKYRVQFLHSEKAFCFKEESSNSGPEANERLMCWAENICSQFRAHQAEELKKIFIDECDIAQTLRRINEYIFCEHYSMWLYNNMTDSFTLSVSSFAPTRTVKKPDTDLESYEGILYKTERFKSSANTNRALENIRTLNRIRLELASPRLERSSQILIVSFYSKFDEYVLRDETVLLIREMLKLKYSKVYYSKNIASNKIVTDLSEQFRIGSFDDYLNTCVTTITQKLGWEAASIFIKDENENLKLKALQDYGNDNLTDSVIYKKGDGSITYGIFNDNKWNFSYDINNHPGNTHKFDERTHNFPKNWIGIPIVAPDQQPIGVLRALNKLDSKKRAMNFDCLDIDILTRLAQSIAYHHSQEQKFIKDEEFIRTSRHEIKTPLTFITTASTILDNEIRKAFKSEGVRYENDDLPKKIREVLDDLRSISSRLIFVANSKTFDARELVTEIKRSAIFREIVAPVISFSEAYARKKKKSVSISKDTVLALSPAKCDVNSSQMALHIILDNAIKYSKKFSNIFVHGKEDENWCRVIVESYSMVAIRPEEQHKIFEKFYRTKEVESKRFEGSGIGLFLAKHIMTLNKGKILLTKLQNPTTFELHFAKWEGKSK